MTQQPNTLPVSSVSDLNFRSEVESFDSGWTVWEVTFEVNGEPFSGYLEADIRFPYESHADMIEDVA
mgnify:CR=1 FL=1